MSGHDLERRIAWFKGQVQQRCEEKQKGVTRAQSSAIFTVMDEAIGAIERIDTLPERASAFWKRSGRGRSSKPSSTNMRKRHTANATWAVRAR